MLVARRIPLAKLIHFACAVEAFLESIEVAHTAARRIFYFLLEIFFSLSFHYTKKYLEASKFDVDVVSLNHLLIFPTKNSSVLMLLLMFLVTKQAKQFILDEIFPVINKILIVSFPCFVTAEFCSVYMHNRCCFNSTVDVLVNK